MPYQDIRLSEHFVLLDFMQDRDNYMTSNPKPVEEFVTAEHIQIGRELCEGLLEPVMARVGPCSIAAGLCPSADVGKGHCTNSPHAWTRALGAAADIAWHDWVNEGRAPIAMMNEIRDVNFERIITYAGSEFVCMSYRSGVNRGALHENIRTPGADKPFFKSYSSGPRDRGRWPDTFPDRPNWRRDDGEPIYHTRRSIRPQHVRVSRYFTLLDFCRSERGLAKGICYVPPLSYEPGILWARRMGEVLDPVVAAVGRLSVTLGVLPQVLANHANGQSWHHWGSDRTAQGVRFVAPYSASVERVEAALDHPAIEVCKHRPHGSGGVEFGLIVRPFEVARQWSSANPPVRMRRRAA